MPLIVETLCQSKEAQSYIEQKGISEIVLRSALENGVYEYQRTSPLHPLTDGGTRAWGAIVAGLRYLLLSQANGWGYKNEYGVSLTYNKMYGMNIIVTSGDNDTGMIEGNPKTKNKKGAATESLVNVNLSLFDDIPTGELLNNKIDPNETWILLYHIDHKLKEVRAELSLPDGISELTNGIKVTSWKRRIILESISLNQQLTEIIKPDFNEDIDFDVTEKVLGE